MPVFFFIPGAPITPKTEPTSTDQYNSCQGPKESYATSLAYSGSFYVETSQGTPCSTETLLNMITEIVGISTNPVSDAHQCADGTMNASRSSFGDEGVQTQATTCTTTPSLYSPGQPGHSYPDSQTATQAQDSAASHLNFASSAQDAEPLSESATFPVVIKMNSRAAATSGGPSISRTWMQASSQSRSPCRIVFKLINNRWTWKNFWTLILPFAQTQRLNSKWRVPLNRSSALEILAHMASALPCLTTPLQLWISHPPVF